MNDTPEAIARGVALGVLIAMTPTVGIQMVIVLVINTIFRASRAAGIIMVYISNPFTVVPIYWLDYRVGSYLWGQKLYSYEFFKESIQAVTEKTMHWDIRGAFGEFMELGGDIAAPMMLGGLIVGIVAGIPVYWITLRMVQRHRARKAARRATRARLRSIKATEEEG
jgi:uncharacterized protein (DUF2062 family)